MLALCYFFFVSYFSLFFKDNRHYCFPNRVLSACVCVCVCVCVSVWVVWASVVFHYITSCECRGGGGRRNREERRCWEEDRGRAREKQGCKSRPLNWSLRRGEVRGRVWDQVVQQSKWSRRKKHNAKTALMHLPPKLERFTAQTVCKKHDRIKTCVPSIFHFPHLCA